MDDNEIGINAQNKHGDTALMLAVDNKNKRGDTAVTLEKNKGKTEVVKALLDHRDDKGNHPIDINVINKMGE